MRASLYMPAGEFFSGHAWCLCIRGGVEMTGNILCTLSLRLKSSCEAVAPQLLAHILQLLAGQPKAD